MLSQAKHNEDSRVKVPAILHLVRLGYTYLSLKDQSWDTTHNIFSDLFRGSVARINDDASAEEIDQLYKKLGLSLDNEDLGKAFHSQILDQSGLKLIDFEDFDNNSFHVVTELPCINGDEEFRPDITLLINGMPLVFIEVKIPHNRDGILAERDRINKRFKNRKFRRFVNITQLMMFSNNMEYDDSSPEPIEGAFYASTSYDEPHFNYFREELEASLPPLLPESEDVENYVLKDTNYLGIKNSPEFATNKDPDSPTHRLCTSIFSRERLAFLLRFGLAYVKGKHGIEKHVMRYPQIFASYAIREEIATGTRKGIIWHTQGSGKTALAYYNVAFLTEHYRQQSVVPKFYFIVDRIDLMTQASREFRSRGLMVHHVNSRDEFATEITSTQAVHNDSGLPEITVVNIQKFKDDPDVITADDYNLDLQRIYFLDEVHRSYNPEGSFLANLKESDSNAIKIGLTGTPLIGDNLKSRDLFGDYIHKYYYNQSIQDGYTLRLIREEIETQYKLQLKQALADIEVLEKSTNREKLYAHEKFVGPMLGYIVKDLETARITHGDHSIGAMVICDSSAQAREMDAQFRKNYAPRGIAGIREETEHAIAAEDEAIYHLPKNPDQTVTSHALILHDEGTKDERKDKVEEFKDGNIDILFVYNMLLTGFDAHRLKKLYLGREIKAHNLLQALTRVNRTYNKFRYGYVVDFADIQAEFEKTNQAYFDELNSELGDELDSYSNLFKSEEEIKDEIGSIKDALFNYELQNAETFSRQIEQIDDRQTMREIARALNHAKSLYNLIRLSGQYEQLKELDFRQLVRLSRDADKRLMMINQKIALENDHDTSNLLNVALEDVLFAFVKVGEDELLIADELRNTLRKTREGMRNNFDPTDPKFITLREELERLFKKKNLSEMSQEDMAANIEKLNSIHTRARELERQNQLLRAKYDQDAKYARLHKRLLEKGDPTPNERKLFEALNALRQQTDERVASNAQLLNNPAFTEVEFLRLIIEQIKNQSQLPLNAESAQFIKNLVMKEYLDEFNGAHPA